MEFPELLHGDFGRRLFAWICCNELLALHTSSSRMSMPALELQAAAWAMRRQHWLLHSKALPKPMEVSKVTQLFSSWLLQGAQIKSSLFTSGLEICADASLCCWPVIRRLAFKQQYISRLPGAPDLCDVLGEDGFLLEAKIPVLKHTLESCGDPLSFEDPLSLEHATEVIEVDKAAAQEVSTRVAKEEAEDDAQRDLDEALPALDAAVACLRKLKASHIQEVKVLPNPPGGVRLACEAICVMFQLKPVRSLSTPEFRSSNYPRHFESLCLQEILSDPKALLDRLTNFDKDNIPDRAAQAALREVHAKIEKLEGDYNQAIAKQDSLQQDMATCEIKLERAHKLIGGLGGEKARWAENVIKLTEQLELLPGDCIVAAGMVSYAGPFTPEPERGT
eukprot:Skav208295  [mRNA]  locus=scaffold897:126960:136184:+ [translate_table: standard]